MLSARSNLGGHKIGHSPKKANISARSGHSEVNEGKGESGTPGETQTPDPLLRRYAIQNSKCRFWCRLRGSASFISPLNWTEGGLKWMGFYYYRIHFVHAVLDKAGW